VPAVDQKWADLAAKRLHDIKLAPSSPWRAMRCLMRSGVD
jgi:hypothetical protein